jgi:hypothetical protein
MADSGVQGRIGWGGIFIQNTAAAGCGPDLFSDGLTGK